MTREEAINEIRTWAIPSEKGREVLETLIPELAESEDERIRKELLKEIEFISPRDGETDGEGLILPSYHARIDRYKSYLEKQKESLPISETCKENADSFTEDERIRKILIHIVKGACGKYGIKYKGDEITEEKLIAYLEKQKEKLGDMSTILLVKKEIERRIETWQKSRKELIAMECNTLADDAAVRIEELYSLISFLGAIRCNTNEKQKEQKPMRTAKEVWKEMRLEVYAQASGNRHEPNCSDDSTKMFSLCDIDEIFDKIGDSTVAPAEEDGPFDEDEFLEDELSAFLQNYDKEYDDDAAVSDVARHFYEIGKKQNEQKSVPFSCGHENGKQAEWAELRTEFNITEAFENGKKEVIDHPDKYGLTKQKPVESIEGGVLTHLGNED